MEHLGLTADEMIGVFNEVVEKATDPAARRRAAQVWEMTGGKVPVFPPGTSDRDIQLITFILSLVRRNNLRIAAQLREAGLPFD